MCFVLVFCLFCLFCFCFFVFWASEKTLLVHTSLCVIVCVFVIVEEKVPTSLPLLSGVLIPRCMAGNFSDGLEAINLHLIGVQQLTPF